MVCVYMKRKSAIIIAILTMCVGFAAVSTTLIINGSAKVSENADDFSVIFTSASLDGQDVYANVISGDKKTIAFETNELKSVNDSSVLTYEVTNNSSNYDAEVSVNCKVKDGTTAKYTSIKNVLENNETIVKAKKSVNGTLTVNLEKVSAEEVREEYVCELTFNAVERGELGKDIPNPVSFTTDSWETIQRAIQTNNTNLYNIGDTKEVDLGSFGIHTVRISNMSKCTNGETSETACGFVIEFADIITKRLMNAADTNSGGWRDSEMRTYVNNIVYESLPNELQKIISSTKVISGHGSTNGEINFETVDKLYLLSTKEIYGTKYNYDALDTETKQLDYYKNKNVSLTNYDKSIKKYNNNNYSWFLRSSHSSSSHDFLAVTSIGACANYGFVDGTYGVSPAFRIA